jgi:peptide/nickel transport system permease protein
MASLARYLIRRAVQGVITLLIVTVIIFILFFFSGNPLDGLRANPAIQPATIRQLQILYGLDQPAHIQLYRYVVNMFTFNFGWSSYVNAPVASVLQEALPRTLFLFGGAVLIEYLIGVFVGRYIAWKRGRVSEGGVILSSLFFYNMPSFWIGLILLFFFAYVVTWFPLRGFQDTPTDPFTALHYPAILNLGGIQFQTILGILAVLGGVALSALAWMRRPKRRLTSTEQTVRLAPGVIVAAFGGFLALIPTWNCQAMDTNATSCTMFDIADIAIHGFLPMLALVLINAAGTILLMQTSMLEVMGEDFILTAKAKGLSERAVRKRHAARNAYLPVVTSLAISLGFVVGGAIILEYIFSYFGLGSYLLIAIIFQDRFLAGSILFLISVLVIFGNIVADMLYGVLDPRVRV